MNNGGQAFPYLDDVHTYPVRGGMTLLDYFAAKALQGLLACDNTWTYEAVVRKCYKLADAMLEAREE